MKLRQISFKIISLVMVFAMLFSVSATTISAAAEGINANRSSTEKESPESTKDKLVYVSIGDSMTNGYGLAGYDGESGILNYGNNVYSNLFAAWLAGYDGEIKDNQVIFEGDKAIVDHRQLAMSGMRAEDLHWILDFDHTNAELAKRAIESRGTNTYGHESALYRHWCSTENGVYPAEEMMKYRWYYDPVFGFKAGDYRTWWDLMDPDYRLANGAAEVLNTYYDPNNDAYGFFESSYANIVTLGNKTMAQHALDSVSNPSYPEENENDYLEMGEQLWLQVATEYYQKSVADADVISLALGNTNFGTFMFQYMKEIIANKEYSSRNNDFVGRYSLEDVYYVADFNDEIKAKVEELLVLIDGIIEANFDPEVLPELDPNVTEFDSMLDYIKYVIKYSVLSYVVNYIAVTERILELNPDVQIIQIALMNAYASADDGDAEGTSMGELIDMLYTPLNTFIAALPTYLQMSGEYPDATFLYADGGTVETMTDVFGDDFYYDEEGNALKYPGLDYTEVAGVNANSTTRQRFVYWVTGYCSRGNQHPGVGLCYCAHDGHKGNVRIDFGEFWKNVLIPLTDPAYKTAGTDYSKAAQNFFGTFDLMFLMDNGTRDYQRLVDYLSKTEEERWAALNDNTVIRTETQTKNGVTYTFNYTQKDLAFSCEMYLAFENAIIRAGKSSISVANLGEYGSFDLSACQGAFESFYEKQGITSITDTVTFNSYADVNALFRNLSDALYENPTSFVMLAMANRMEIGTGIGGHTSEGGHYYMSETIKRVYESNYTSEQEIMNVLESLLKENYPNLYEAMAGVSGMGKMDDIAIIITMLKLYQSNGNIPALESIDLDALEAQIRASLKSFAENKSPEEQMAAQEDAYNLLRKLYSLAVKITGTNYLPNEDSFYVSLGDSNVNGFGLEGYVENMQNGIGQVVEGSAPVMLAKALYGKNWKDYFGQYAQGALRCEDMLYILGDDSIVLDDYYYDEIKGNLLVPNDIEATREAYIEALKRADLISITIGGGNVTTFVGEQMDRVVAGEELVEMDWAKIGYSIDALDELNELLDLLVPIIDAMGMLDKYVPAGVEIENPAYFAYVLAESLLYGYASYNYYYPQVLDAIRAINPDAQLMILGMFNPVDDWNLTTVIGGEELFINIGGIVSNVMDSVNMQNLAYAVQNDNTIFVYIGDVVTFLDEEYDNGEKPTFEVYYKSILEGNGKEVHASANGHKYMYSQMYAALSVTGYDDEILSVVTDLYDLLVKYHDEIYADAYAELKARGVIANVKAALEAAIEAVVAAQAEVEGLEVDARLEETKALLVSELVLTEATLYQINNLLNHETITAETIETLELLLENLKAHLENLGELAVEVGGIALEVIEYAANEAAKLASEIVSKVYAYVIDKAPEVYAAFVNAVVEAVKYYSHEAAIYCYNWLYNNPEKVIGFFAEYGDDIAEFIAENSEIIFGVIGYVGTNYGEEIVDLLLDNADVILPAIAGWYEIHGEYVWDLVKVYFETIIGYIDFDLDLDFTSPEGIHESLNKIFLLLGELVEKIADGVYDYVESLGILEEIEAELAKLGLKLKEAAIAGAIELGEFICETICKFVDWAISGKFTPTEDSYYVSVNGGNAYYAELLAEKLAENLDVDSIKLGTTTWDNLDYEMLSKADLVTIGYDENELSGFAVEQMLAYVVNYVDETLRGDVTEYVSGVYAILQGWIDGNELNYDLGQHEEETLAGLNGIIDELLAYEIIAGKELSDMDWAKYVGEENLSYVEEVRAALKAELLASGVIETYTYTIDVVEYIYENYEALGISAEALAVVPKTTAYKVLGEKAYYTVEVPVADSIVFAAESYLYGNVEFQAEYCKLVLDLYEINPEATVILLGAYNAYDLELTLGDVAVDLGEVYGYVAGLASVQPVAYALLSEKVAFVDISDAETVYESYVAAGSAEGSLAEFVALYLLDSSITDASEAGNVYIYEQIMNILSVGCQHVYDNACDESCNKCGEIREAADHVYDNVCDEICNVCGDAREAGHTYVDGVCVNCGEKESIKHVHSYNSCYDTACRVCGETREAEEHAYDNCEDKTCYKCDEVREAIDHVYDSCDDLTCNACGMEREAREHVYSNACDAECNVCGESRTAGEHSYNGCTDADCNVCGEKREVSEHKFDGCADETCNVCGEIVVITGHKYGAWTVTVEATRKNAGEKSRVCSECDHVDTKTIAALGGIGGGAIAAIVVASVVVAGAAGFAIFWFVVQKKSFAALVEMIKGGNAAPAAEEAPKSEEEAPKTEEEAK